MIDQFDVVVVVGNVFGTPIKAGFEGTVVDLLNHDGTTIYEVEFADEVGQTLHIGHFCAHELRRVWSFREHRIAGTNPAPTPKIATL